MKNLLNKGIQTSLGTISIPHTKYYSKNIYLKNSFPNSKFVKNPQLHCRYFITLKGNNNYLL